MSDKPPTPVDPPILPAIDVTPTRGMAMMMNFGGMHGPTASVQAEKSYRGKVVPYNGTPTTRDQLKEMMREGLTTARLLSNRVESLNNDPTEKSQRNQALYEKRQIGLKNVVFIFARAYLDGKRYDEVGNKPPYAWSRMAREIKEILNDPSLAIDVWCLNPGEKYVPEEWMINAELRMRWINRGGHPFGAGWKANKIEAREALRKKAGTVKGKMSKAGKKGAKGS